MFRIDTQMDGSFEQPQAYLNGHFVPASTVAISPTDTGFVQGVTVAEQLRTFAGRLFHLDGHLERLEHSLEIVEVDVRLHRGAMTEIAQELVARNGRLMEPGDDLGLSIFATPGQYSGYSPPGLPEPVFCMHTYPLQFRHWAAKYQTGQALVTTDIEQVSPRCWPPGVKCRSRMHYFLADRHAAHIEPGARALLLDHDGFVTEASTANVILLAEGRLVSPPRGAVLQGISMRVVEQLAAQLGISTSERTFRPEVLAASDEVFLTSTPYCLLPVTRFNGKPIGNGRPGPMFRRLLAAWSQMAGVDIAEQAERFAARVG